MIKRSLAFIDKLTVTIPVRMEDRTNVKNYLLMLVRGNHRFIVRRHKASTSEPPLYKYSYRFRVDGIRGKSRRAIIDFEPTLKHAGRLGFIRIDWNPSKVVRSSINELIQMVSAQIPNFKEIWKNAKVSRADITVNVYGQDIAQISAFAKSSAAHNYIYRERCGNRINGIYLGKRSSTRQLCVYDKVLEQHGSNSVRIYREGKGWTTRLLRHMTRVEFKLRNLGKIRDIAFWKNKLTGYSIIQLTKARELSSSEKWQDFVDECEQRGAQVPLKWFSDKQRTQNRNVLNARCKPDWFDKERMWAEALDELQDILRIR